MIVKSTSKPMDQWTSGSISLLELVGLVTQHKEGEGLRALVDVRGNEEVRVAAEAKIGGTPTPSSWSYI